MDTGIQGEGKAGSAVATGKTENNNKLSPIPDPHMTVYVAFFHRLMPKLALGLQFAFQPTLPHPRLLFAQFY